MEATNQAKSHVFVVYLHYALITILNQSSIYSSVWSQSLLWCQNYSYRYKKTINICAVCDYSINYVTIIYVIKKPFMK